MKGKRSKKDVLDRIIEGLLCALIILAPLLFFRFIKDSFDLPKMSLIQFFVFTMFLLWLIRIILRGELRIVKPPLCLPLFIFLGIEVLSLIWAKNAHPGLRFVSQDVAFGLLVVVVLNTVRTEKRIW